MTLLPSCGCNKSISQPLLCSGGGAESLEFPLLIKSFSPPPSPPTPSIHPSLELCGPETEKHDLCLSPLPVSIFKSVIAMIECQSASGTEYSQCQCLSICHRDQKCSSMSSSSFGQFAGDRVILN